MRPSYAADTSYHKHHVVSICPHARISVYKCLDSGPVCRGWWELAPLLDYLSMILDTVKVKADLSQRAAQYWGQLDDSEYVQTNPAASQNIYATLQFPNQYIPVSRLAL